MRYGRVRFRAQMVWDVLRSEDSASRKDAVEVQMACFCVHVEGGGEGDLHLRAHRSCVRA